MTGTPIVISRIIVICDVNDRARFNRQIRSFSERAAVLPFKNLNIAANIYSSFPAIVAERTCYDFINCHHFAVDFHVSW